MTPKLRYPSSLISLPLSLMFSNLLALPCSPPDPDPLVAPPDPTVPPPLAPDPAESSKEQLKPGRDLGPLLYESREFCFFRMSISRRGLGDMERLARLGEARYCPFVGSGVAPVALPPLESGCCCCCCWLRNLRCGVGLRLRYFPELGERLLFPFWTGAAPDPVPDPAADPPPLQLAVDWKTRRAAGGDLKKRDDGLKVILGQNF